jgi:hypothetical protein
MNLAERKLFSMETGCSKKSLFDRINVVFVRRISRYVKNIMMNWIIYMKNRLLNMQCLLLVFFVLISCSTTTSTNLTNKQTDLTTSSNDYLDAFVQVTGARDEKIFKLGNSRRMTCQVESLYPSTEVISEIKAKLSAKGWEPLKDDFMNPGLPTSYVKGWDKFTDKDHIPPTKVYRWTADWKNKSNEVTRYILIHEYPLGIDSPMSELHITAEYYPASIVEKVKSKKR